MKKNNYANLIPVLIIVIIVAIAVISAVSIAVIGLTQANQVVEKEAIMFMEVEPEIPLSFSDSVKQQIEMLNIAHSDIVFKQIIIETGNFSSLIFKENNNLTGMRKAYNRPHVQTGVNRGYATYESWKMSIVDYAILQSWSAKRLNRAEYLE